MTIKETVKRLIPRKVLASWYTARRLGDAAWWEYREQRLGQIFPMRPRTLSLMANDICNSRCQMCLIWERKRDHEFTLNELREAIRDPLFSKISDVGITGGEPTLRKDLPDIVRLLCEEIRGLRSVSIITNAIRQAEVTERVLACSAVCREFNIPFSVMVSLDGVGPIHDRIRGREGNFESAFACLTRFREEGLTTSFGCTVTVENAEFVDEMMDFAEAEGLYGRFRIAEFIERLYNSPQSGVIRNFDDLTRYHLRLFFFRAEHCFEPHALFRKTYRNIRGMLAPGGKRTIGCPYQTRSVVVSTRGELMYCSPKSPIVGNVFEASADGIYFGGLDARRKVIKESCETCIHDYHVPIGFSERLRARREVRRRARVYAFEKLLAEAASLTGRRNTDHHRTESVLIVGWYGTETAGDKAILWSILNELAGRKSPPKRILLSSFQPFHSEWTLKELRRPEPIIIETYTEAFEEACRTADEVIVGGGPLMDMEALDHVLYAFVHARRRGAVARIAGCGIGPLHGEKYRRTVAALLRLSNVVQLRDRKSEELGRALCDRTDYAVTGDPACDYVAHHRGLPGAERPEPPLGRSPNIGFFLREMTHEYVRDLTADEFGKYQQGIEEALCDLAMTLAARLDAAIHLLPMHCFTIGGDDRILNRRLARRILGASHSELMQSDSVKFARLPVSPGEILESMRFARLNVCMRFHSVLFADQLGVPYIAIDYTNGGKIASYLAERGREDRLLTLDEVVSGFWKERVRTMVDSIVRDAAAPQPSGEKPE